MQRLNRSRRVKSQSPKGAETVEVLRHIQVLAVPMHASNDGMTASLSESVRPPVLLAYCVGREACVPFCLKSRGQLHSRA